MSKESVVDSIFSILDSAADKVSDLIEGKPKEPKTPQSSDVVSMPRWVLDILALNAKNTLGVDVVNTIVENNVRD